MTNELNRRDFMKKAVVTAAATSISMAGVSTGRVLGANDRIRLGLIGSGKQGVSNMKYFIDQGVEAVAICDVYETNLAKGLTAAGGSAKSYKDFRQLLEDKSIDMVINATPDHWHALATVAAFQAGKDVYTEKPTATTIEESKKMVEAARKYKRVVQCGTWQRSNVHFQKAIEAIQDGIIGKVTFAKTWNYANIYPEGIGNPPDSDPPAGLDWDFWLGPAPKVPFNVNRFGILGDRWATFRYFYDYAGGWVGDWCVHLLDIVHWAMKVDGPTAVSASGSKVYLKDNSDVPEVLQITFDYPGFICTYENRLCNSNSMYGKGGGTEFHGTDGTMFVDRSGYQVFPESAKFHDKEVGRTAAVQMSQVDDGLALHAANMLDCMHTRKTPASDIENCHRTSSACLLGNIALRTQERIVWDAANQKMTVGSAKAQKLLDREYRAPWKLTV
jgi:predicted dehydrogenase